MKKKKRRLLRRTFILSLMLAAIFYTLYNHLSKELRTVAAVGDEAPDFILKDLDGNTYQLSDFRGKGVFLNFWGTYCEPCKEEMPYIDNQYKRYKNQGVEVIAINVGETELAIETFSNQHRLSFPIVVDKDGDVQDAYGIFPLPATFLIDSEGKIVEKITGRMNEQMVKGFMEAIKP